MFENKNKELNEYKETLDKKILLLKNKILNSKNNKNISSSTIKDTNRSNSNNKMNYGFSKIYSLKGAISFNPLKLDSMKDSQNITIRSIVFLNYDLFCKTFFNNEKKDKNKILYNFLSLIDNNDLYKLFSINKFIKNELVNFFFDKIKEKIIPKFIKKYCNDILFTNKPSFKIIKKPYKKKGRLHIRLLLNIKAQITVSNIDIINKKYQILYQILNPKDILQSTFSSHSLEFICKYMEKKFWVFKEYTSFHYDEHDKSYYNDLLQFWPGDYVLINIGLMNESGILDFDNFHWMNPKIIPKIDKSYIKDLYTQAYLTNSQSTCEVEGLVLECGWLGIEQMDSSDNVINTLNELFGEFFEINKIFFQDVGYYFFKIILKAKKQGKCQGKNNNLGITINIWPQDIHITNEVKKNGFIFDENNELNINVDDILTFYISQNK
jgi:hypothetical protein